MKKQTNSVGKLIVAGITGLATGLAGGFLAGIKKDSIKDIGNIFKKKEQSESNSVEHTEE